MLNSGPSTTARLMELVFLEPRLLTMTLVMHQQPMEFMAACRFNDGAVADLGIGNKPTGQPDWALSSNANTYGVRKLQVYVTGVPEGPTPFTPAPTVQPTP
eukprot:2431683-Ditylum_brightwellii.AAC.1